jgi:hypothetical protein
MPIVNPCRDAAAGRVAGRAIAVAAVCLAAILFGSLPAAEATTITLGTFTKTGGDVDASVTNASPSGGTMSYVTDTDTRSDAGLFATTDSPGGYTFTNVGDKVVYAFTYEAITVGTNSSPQFRTGFDFGSSAFLYHATSTGTGGSLGFWANTTGNPFTTGTQVGSTITTWSDFANQFIRFNAGNTINATVSLTLDAINGSTYDYLYEVTYNGTATGGTDSNSASQLFTGIAANTMDRIFHGANNANVSAAGNTWTVSNASIAIVPEPGAAVLLGVLGCGLLGWAGRQPVRVLRLARPPSTPST